MTKTQDQRPKRTSPENEDQKLRADEVSAIILAAGLSRRMGAFKPLLRFGPTTVIEACIENIRAGGVENVVVVLGESPQAAKLKRHLRYARVTFAFNPDPNSEMSASLACGIRALPDDARAIIINPADHAAVPAEVVAQLIAEWRSGAKLIKPTWNGRGGHPVLVDLSFRGELLSLDPQTGLKGLFDEHTDDVRCVPVTSNFIARDLDTWDDYRALHQEVFGVPPPEIPAKDDSEAG
jgi:molybdenum cofactor cytidylyltransferase